jgi:transcriptional regulator with XRE-family HTH domain
MVAIRGGVCYISFAETNKPFATRRSLNFRKSEFLPRGFLYHFFMNWCSWLYYNLNNLISQYQILINLKNGSMHKSGRVNPMFWDKYVALCNKVKKSPNAVAKEIGISSGAVSGWKNGNVPQAAKLLKIADYFGVPVSYFSEEFKEAKRASALNDKVEAIMKVYDMLTPENKERFSDSLSEILSELLKEQLQG